MSTTGRSAAAPIVASEEVSLTQALLWIMTFRLVRLLGESSVPMLMGDWFKPALHASFSGARDAQLNGPSIGPYPNVLTSTVPFSLPAALLNIESPWRHVAEAVEAKMRDLRSILKQRYAMILEAGKEWMRCETMLLLKITQRPESLGTLWSRRKDPQQRSSCGESSGNDQRPRMIQQEISIAAGSTWSSNTAVELHKTQEVLKGGCK